MNIIKLDRRHIQEMAEVDMNTGHRSTRLLNLTKKDIIDELMKAFKRRDETFYGICIGKELVAYIGFRPSFPGHNHCEVHWIGVKKAYQGRGIGTKLMKFIEQYAMTHGCRKICLYTGKTMRKARHFYEKLGYRQICEFPDYYGYSRGNTTAVLYCKKLQKR